MFTLPENFSGPWDKACKTVTLLVKLGRDAWLPCSNMLGPYNLVLTMFSREEAFSRLLACT